MKVIINNKRLFLLTIPLLLMFFLSLIKPTPTKAEEMELLGCSVSPSMGIGGAIAQATRATDIILNYPDTENSIGLSDISILENIDMSGDFYSRERDCILNKIALSSQEMLTRSMTASVVNWVNTGFDGGPAFVTNLSQHMNETKKDVVGNFVNGDTLSSLHSSFVLPVKRALLMNFSGNKGKISQNELINNSDDPIADLSEQWDWDKWLAITTDPNGNPFGAYINASHSLSQKIEAKQEEEKEKLNWGKGFLSFENCEGEGDEKICSIQTPGSVINEQLNQILPNGIKNPQIANEINSATGDLISRSIQQVLGPTGLSGMSNNSSNGPSYTEKLMKEQSGSTDSIKTFGKDKISSIKENEVVFLNIKTDFLNKINGGDIDINGTIACYQNKTATKWRVLEPSLDGTLNIVTSGFNEIGNRISESLIPENATIKSEEIMVMSESLKSSLEKEIERSNSFIQANDILTKRLSSATTTVQVNNIIIEIYKLQKSDTSNLGRDIINLENQIRIWKKEKYKCESFNLTEEEKDILMCTPSETENCAITTVNVI